MTRGRPAWIEQRIDFHLARQRARRTHPEACECPYCITSAQIERRIRAKIAAQNQASGEPPF
jgi:hypothetical protein